MSLGLNCSVPEQSAAYRAVDPRDGEAYAYSAFLLEPIAGHLDEEGGRLKVVDLTQIATFRGFDAVLGTNVVARMTPEGRRALRIKLGYFWARAEAEDASLLGDTSELR